MQLIIIDRATESRRHFYPLALSRPLWELRVGFTSLGEKLRAKIGADNVAYFLPEYMADAYRAGTQRPVNQMSVLRGQDTLVVDARLKADHFHIAAHGRSEVGLDENGEVLYAHITEADLKQLKGSDIGTFLESAKATLPTAPCKLPRWEYTWDLILANGDQITTDFAAAGRHGIEGNIEEPIAVRGSRKDVYIAPGVTIHPMVVIDAEHGPVYIDEGAEIHPFSRIEGP